MSRAPAGGFKSRNGRYSSPAPASCGRNSEHPKSAEIDNTANVARLTYDIWLWKTQAQSAAFCTADLSACPSLVFPNEVSPSSSVSWSASAKGRMRTVVATQRPLRMDRSAQTSLSREIRAHYTEDTITVYQAYSTEIGTAAVNEQRLDASPKFSTTRMTWIKPSWAWMLYRSGYSFKDSRQECILALSVKAECFMTLLETAVVATSHTVKKTEVNNQKDLPRVRVQWDPERTIRLEKLPYRSIQIGIPGALVKDFMIGIVHIKNVTEQARELKKTLDESQEVDLKDLMDKGLVPDERILPVSGDLQYLLGMAGQEPT
ncbi:hypothetical protein OPT61_g5500 [Boeremia exigua]|uniref:Uncharacterized protein n=1 Tax=Boeremia exigua TaxID=749465 RepID=A0ACC2IA71_9PLEO|nr:hypothetical protein OPT61_g5500 [Boeremia exigua]